MSEDAEPGTSNSETTPKNPDNDSTSMWSTVADVINAGHTALQDLNRANFTSDVHFCPPHFLDHKFFTEEMALEYARGTLIDGPLRNYRGKIWEELIYHGLKENLPKLLDNAIQCMWVFNGLELDCKSDIFKLLNIKEETSTEIDILIVALTKTNKLLIVPIEIKKEKTSKNKPKAKRQCKTYTAWLTELIHSVLPQNIIISPAIFFCHDQSPIATRITHQRSDTGSEKQFSIYLGKYDEFKYNTESINNESSSNFFSWINQLASENNQPNCSSDQFQELVCLIATIFSCKSKNVKKHDERTCYKHFKIKNLNKEICMKGTQLCPKFVHEYVINNVDFLTYLKTFCGNNTEAASESANFFKSHFVNELPADVACVAKDFMKFLTNQQLAALQSDEKRVILHGDYGTGKTRVMLIKAMSTLRKIENGTTKGRILFISTSNHIKMDIIPKFKHAFSSETLEKYVLFQSWVDFKKMEGTVTDDDYCFCDEYADSYRYDYNDDEDIIDINDKERFFLHQQAKASLVWIVVVSKDPKLVHKEFAVTDDFVLLSLGWNLRNSHTISNLYTTMGTISEADTASFDKTMDLNYPIYGARVRIDPGPHLEMNSLIIREIQYWLTQIKLGSILVVNFSLKEEATTADLITVLNKEFTDDIHFEDLNDLKVFVSTVDNFKRGYVSSFADHSTVKPDFFGLEFDIAIFIWDSQHNNEHVLFDAQAQQTFWVLFSRAKYGVSLCATEWFDAKALEQFSKWGRCSVINSSEQHETK